MRFLLARILFFVLILSGACSTFAQIRTPRTRTGERSGDLLDSLRKKDEGRQDTIIYTSRYIRYTTRDLLKDSTKTAPIDTSVRNFENFSPIAQPERPTVSLGNMGLAARDMLFNPSRQIGFDAGFHALDAYLLTQDSIRYYRARTPYSELYYISGGQKEQLLKVTLAQNITPTWNFGANYFRNASDGFYKNQNANHTNAAVFTWYESKNKRYNVLANAIFNILKAAENGSVVRDSLFLLKDITSSDLESVRLNGTGNKLQPRQTWREKNFYLKQFYYIGRIDSLTADSTTGSVLPTQRIAHAINYSTNTYKFFSNEEDIYGVFPPQVSGQSTTLTNDLTQVRNLRNEFTYSFYLRGKTVKFLKNELKLEVGMQHDLYWYEQMGYRNNFQNIALKARPGYRFSNKMYLEGDLQQIFQGRNAGDYFYEARANILLSRSVGRIVLGAYAQNKSPEQIFERVDYKYHQWQQSFDRTKINNFNFTYENPKFKTTIRADYFLITDYLYLQGSSLFPNVVTPQQKNSDINLLKIALQKNFTFGKFNLENYLVYQKTDAEDLLRTPEFYSYHSFYFANKFFKKALDAHIGFDIRYNTPFVAPAYAINISQFYNGSRVTFSNYPVAAVWLRATLKRANLFLKYDYVNQGLFSKGYYTVNRYPMQNRLLKFGVSWKFYD